MGPTKARLNRLDELYRMALAQFLKSYFEKKVIPPPFFKLEKHIPPPYFFYKKSIFSSKLEVPITLARNNLECSAIADMIGVDELNNFALIINFKKFSFDLS